MKPILIAVTLVSTVFIASCGGRNEKIAQEHLSSIEQLVDAQPVHLSNHNNWSEDILTLSNCIKNNGAPKDVIHKGDTVTLVYGQDSTMELVYVRDTLYCEIMD